MYWLFYGTCDGASSGSASPPIRPRDCVPVAGSISLERGSRYLIRDSDAKFGDVFKQSIYRMGIRDRPVAPRSPWQNCYVERVIGSIRRELLDHIIVWSEPHLRRLLARRISKLPARTHIGIAKDSPDRRPMQRCGVIVVVPLLGGLHHRYARM
jgi:hypothetical protein